jgi:mono/diheme cytochrome c family protein
MNRSQLCMLALSLIAASASAQTTPVTYHRDIAPILQANCQECHRPGGIGPFSLLTYADAREHAAAIRAMTAARIMPPWKAAPGFGEFADERRLSAEQIATVTRWLEAGTPEGDPKDAPPPRQWVEGWTLGNPDLVLDAGAAFSVPATGRDIYRDFVLPFYSEEERWISAVEVAPGSSEVVHHVVLYLDPEDQARAKDAADPGPGFTVFGADAGFSPALWLYGWAPGALARRLPEGSAWRIPPHTRIVMQVHYHPHGHAVKDRTQIGLYFAKGPVDKRVRASVVGSTDFVIPAGAARHPVSAELTLPMDITLLALWPHMHQIGKEMKLTATLPDGREEPLVWLPAWDFNWQLIYTLKKPLPLPWGTQISLQALYDNSAANPFNPNRPPRTVRFGPQTTDEMCFGFFLYTLDDEHIADGLAIDDDPIEIRQ